jgi:outer membrane protein TolC
VVAWTCASLAFGLAPLTPSEAAPAPLTDPPEFTLGSTTSGSDALTARVARSVGIFNGITRSFRGGEWNPPEGMHPGTRKVISPSSLPIDLNAEEEGLLADYQAEAVAADRPGTRFRKTLPVEMPEDFSPWWLDSQHGSIGSGNSMRSSLEDLYVRALANSKQIKVFSDLPLIRETGIQEAKGAFDTNSFLEGRFEHTDDPVGNVLTTGGPDRFKQDEWTVRGGIRKKAITGTEVTLDQEWGRLDNNSVYFVPDPQSRTRLALTVVQPLLKGNGITYNRSIIEVAKLDSEVAMHEFVRQSESHLLEIARTYWALHAARVTYLQKAKLVDDTLSITDELKGRTKLDARQSQLFRAESALASRRADLVRNEAAIRNAQDRLRALTGDPDLLASNVEIIPTDRLILSRRTADTRQAAEIALQNRPEVNQAFLQLRAANIRERMAKNELLPELNLVLQGSLQGLDNGDFGGPYSRQYSEGSPGWGAGIVFSFPFENNAARARYERRRIERRQQINQIKTAVDTVLLEVKISAREVATALREAQAKYAAVRAFTEDIDTIEARRSVLAFNDAVATSTYLDSVLDAQDRLTVAEEDFIRSAANYQIALVNLERSKGKLLSYENVSIIRERDQNNLPLLRLEKGAAEKAVLDYKSLN